MIVDIRIFIVERYFYIRPYERVSNRTHIKHNVKKKKRKKAYAELLFSYFQYINEKLPL